MYKLFQTRAFTHAYLKYSVERNTRKKTRKKREYIYYNKVNNFKDK